MISNRLSYLYGLAFLLTGGIMAIGQPLIARLVVQIAAQQYSGLPPNGEDLYYFAPLVGYVMLGFILLTAVIYRLTHSFSLARKFALQWVAYDLIIWIGSEIMNGMALPTFLLITLLFALLAAYRFAPAQLLAQGS